MLKQGHLALLIALVSLSILLGGGGQASAIGSGTIQLGVTGESPMGVAVNSTTNRFYVANHSTNTVSVFDGATNLWLATIQAGDGPWGVAVDETTTNRIYVSNEVDCTLSIIDGSNNTLVASIDECDGPSDAARGVAVNESTHMVYVAHEHSIHVIDASTNTVSDIIPFDEQTVTLISVAVDPTTNRIYATGSELGSICENGFVFVIDGNHNQVTSSMATDDGRCAYGVGVNPIANRIYVAEDSRVAVIDGDTNAVVANVDGVYAHDDIYTPHGIAVNPHGHRVYTADAENMSSAVIDTDTNEVVTIIPLLRYGGQMTTEGVSVNPKTNLVYVTTTSQGCVSVIDGGADTVIANVPTRYESSYLAANTTTNMVYAANYGPNVLAIDGSNSEVTANITVDGLWALPYLTTAIAVNSDANRVYVATQLSPGLDGVSVINPSSGETLYAIPITVPSAVAVISDSPTTSRVYVATVGGAVQVVQESVDTYVLGPAVTVGNDPRAMAVNPSANRIYVANQGSNSVSVIDGATNLVVATVTVGSQPAGIAVNPNTGRVYVTNTSAGTVSVIDGTKNVVTATVGVGTNPKGVAVNTTSDRVFVANSGSSSVSVIDGVTNAVVGTVTVGLAPYGVAANPNTNRVYVANSGNGTVSLIEDPVDWDRDGVLDSVDNCPYVYNPDQQASHYGPRSAGPRIPGGRASNPASNPQGDACYVTLPQPPCDRSADTDGDGILDCLEHKYNTCAYAGDPYPGYTSCVNPSDSDGDNCPDWLEIMDINGDRTVDGTDQLLLARRASGQIPPDPVSDAIFDVNKDGKINVADQYLMGINTCDYRRSHGYTGPCPCSPE